MLSVDGHEPVAQGFADQPGIADPSVDHRDQPPSPARPTALAQRILHGRIDGKGAVNDWVAAQDLSPSFEIKQRDFGVSIAARRYIYGQDQVNPPSRFAAELPREHVQTVGRSPFASAPRRPAWADSGFESKPAPKPAEPSWDDDIELEPEMDAGEGVSVYVGMPIRHPKFGVGEVLAWSGNGQDMKLTLRFPTEARTKTILARFCQPV